MSDTVLVVGASLRLTRAVTTDEIGALLVREPLHRAAPDSTTLAGRIVDGVYCPFCVGFWLGAAVLAGHALTAGSPRGRAAWRFVAAALTLNEIVGHVSARIDQ